ncbi:PepSY-associated TM helix domain-containing protein [Sphingomonas colocasiae]|uniref:PepSY domain-containing protein n=1 Tax=Sphingomonas colocasiae TaxID=1848973 RepID=A0ABS7PJX2_9SPHN|nr:PepSY-associated TM helix domain-containing protein [Sphingomonas colocasiae]MBY8821591.1 PepSY domain-containing protein [Sphingomonas colocasiae]
MTAAARRTVSPRRLLRLWHRWFGLFAALWLLALSLTGSAIVFYDELDRWLNADWHSVPVVAAGTESAADDALAAAHAALPGFSPRYIDLPDRPGDTIMLIGADGNGAPVQMFAHPDSGRLLGWRVGGSPAFDRRHVMDSLYALHMDLMLGPAMAWFLGLVSLLWAIDHIPAALLAVPRLAALRSAFLVKGRRLRRLFDLHRAPGMWLYPATLVLAVTGVCLTWQEESRDAVRLFSPVSDRLHYAFDDTVEAGTAPAIGIAHAVAIARRYGAGPADSVAPIAGKGVYGVRSFDPRDLDGMGRLWTYIRMSDGQVVGQRHDNGESAGDLFFAWQYPLHSGKAFGMAGRIAIFVAGLATAALCMTGILLWWRRRRPT